MPPLTVPSEFVLHLKSVAGPRPWVRFDEFMQAALYAPNIGYYQKQRERVGRSLQADFFTATSSGTLFGELICAAATELAGKPRVGDLHFVEIGAEPGPDGSAGGVLQGVKHPFASARTIRLGDPIEISGPAIVFSNELFDAQPFRRFVRQGEKWVELGVHLEDDRLIEGPVDSDHSGVPLPDEAPEGYHLDLPLAATDLLKTILKGDWEGLFLAFDYGKAWLSLISENPAGTARAYHQHKQHNDLLARPTDQDITCHVCWDWLANTLREHRFKVADLMSQESFFVHHAADTIAKIMAEEAPQLSARKMAMMQLLHPANMGQKFQVLHAKRAAL